MIFQGLFRQKKPKRFSYIPVFYDPEKDKKSIKGEIKRDECSNIPDNNYAFYSNPELDDLLEKSRSYPDGPEREKVVKEAQRLLRREVPVITFDNSEQMVGIRKYVTGS